MTFSNDLTNPVRDRNAHDRGCEKPAREPQRGLIRCIGREVRFKCPRADEHSDRCQMPNCKQAGRDDKREKGEPPQLLHERMLLESDEGTIGVPRVAAAAVRFTKLPDRLMRPRARSNVG